jgi:hypothetical protein
LQSFTQWLDEERKGLPSMDKILKLFFLNTFDVWMAAMTKGSLHAI